MGTLLEPRRPVDPLLGSWNSGEISAGETGAGRGQLQADPGAGGFCSEKDSSILEKPGGGGAVLLESWLTPEE